MVCTIVSTYTKLQLSFTIVPSLNILPIRLDINWPHTTPAIPRRDTDVLLPYSEEYPLLEPLVVDCTYLTDHIYTIYHRP